MPHGVANSLRQRAEFGRNVFDTQTILPRQLDLPVLLHEINDLDGVDRRVRYELQRDGVRARVDLADA